MLLLDHIAQSQSEAKKEKASLHGIRRREMLFPWCSLSPVSCLPSPISHLTRISIKNPNIYTCRHLCIHSRQWFIHMSFRGLLSHLTTIPVAHVSPIRPIISSPQDCCRILPIPIPCCWSIHRMIGHACMSLCHMNPLKQSGAFPLTCWMILDSCPVPRADSASRLERWAQTF